jgi:Flp pilus assembly protein TadG
MMKVRSLLAQFWRRRDGVAAVEFAIVSVAMAGLAAAMLAGWQFATTQTAAQTAANAGAFFYLQGGTSDSAAQSFALAAWPNRPDNASISIARLCTCAGATATCTSLCSDNSVPHTQITITAYSSSQDGLLNLSTYATEVARVR